MISVLLSTSLYAEERKKSKAEEMATAGSKAPVAELGKKRTAKLTEEQVIEQLKYMMVQGWVRINDELLESGDLRHLGS